MHASRLTAYVIQGQLNEDANETKKSFHFLFAPHRTVLFKHVLRQMQTRSPN